MSSRKTRAKIPFLQRLESHIISKDGCWLTDLLTLKNGKTQISIEGKMKSTHRVVYEIDKGEIPDGMYVNYTCQNPGCINPDHLFLSSSKREYKKVDIQQRLEGHIIDKSCCWITDLASNNQGYPVIRSEGKTINASRLMYKLHYKTEIPKDICVCHKCDNPHCINPSHLFLGTKKENSQDMLHKNREARGDKLPQTKLTEVQVKEIKLLLAKGDLSKGKIGKLFGVSSATIWDIEKGITWKYV
jgi:hypothetical protein